jgi:amidase
MRFPEYDDLDGIALADLVRRREISAAEVVEAAIDRVEARDGALNAVVYRFDDLARAAARAPLPDGPLSGVPFLLKDILGAMEGQPLSFGSRLLAGFRAPSDSAYVRRARGGGLLPLGRSNVPEFGIVATTESVLHGPCRNPWDLDRTPGGSSGGSAAAVAARIVPFAHANDGGGSIRIPAAHCGVFGLKPSRGRISLAPLGEGWSGLVTEGAVTRSVRDTAALLDLLAGPEPGDPFVVAPPQRPYREEVGATPGQLRVAFTIRPLLGRVAHPDCRAAVEETARLLVDLGHHVRAAEPPIEREELVRAYLTIVAANVSAEIEEAARRVGRRPSAALLEPATRALVLVGQSISGLEMSRAQFAIQGARNAMARFMAEHDVLLTATAARPPVKLGELALRWLERIGIDVLERVPVRRLLDLLVDAAVENAIEATPNTQLMNLTGQPAASVPLTWSAAGLPIGVQLAARPGEEGLLLRLASQLEAARPWAGRKPPIVEST